MRASIVLGEDFIYARLRACVCVWRCSHMVHETWHIISVDERVAFQKRSRTLLDHSGVNLREKRNWFLSFSLSLSLFSLSLGRPVIIESSLTRTIFRSLAIDFFPSVRPFVRLFVYSIPFRVLAFLRYFFPIFIPR